LYYIPLIIRQKSTDWYTPTLERTSTETVTVRLSSDILKILRTDSEEKEVSLNTLMNQIVRQHIYWYRLAPKAGFVPVRRSLLTKLLERYSSEEVVELASSMAMEKFKELVLVLGKEHTILSAFTLLEVWLKVSGFVYTHHIHKGMHTYIIEHNMGLKWSVYLEQLCRLIADSFQVTFECEKGDNSLMFRIYIENYSDTQL
jgi:hypothetical protein